MAVQIKKGGKVRFSYKPESPVKTVSLAGSFNNWEQRRIRKQKSGEYVANAQIPDGTHEYKFIVDDIWKVDTENELQTRNSFGEINSVVVV